MNIRRSAAVLVTLFFLPLARPAEAQIDARMFRQPAVSKTQIAFVYAGDIWLVPRKGGAAVAADARRPARNRSRGSRPTGRRSPTAPSYDGNVDVFVVAAAGGEPVRLTHHPMADRVIGWTPDGKRVLFASSRESGRQRYSQFYTRRPRRRAAGEAAGAVRRVRRLLAGRHAVRLHADVAGLPHLEAVSRRLGAGPVAVRSEDVRVAQHHRRTRPTTRSRCGTATRSTSCRIAAPTSATTSGRYDVAVGKVAAGHAVQRLRHHVSVDRAGRASCSRPAAGCTCSISRPRKPAEVPDPRRHRRDDAAAAHGEGRGAHQRRRGVADRQARGVRGRGDVVHRAGRVRRGRQRDAHRPASPSATRAGRRTARRVAYWSDRSGEYELTLRAGRRRRAGAEGHLARRRASATRRSGRPTARSSRSSTRRCGSASTTSTASRVTEIDQSPDWIGHGGLETFRIQWSPDSRWLTYARPDRTTRNSAVFLYDTKSGEAAPGHDRLPERHAADVRSRGQVPLLRVRSRVRPGLRQLRQQLDLSEPDAARRGAAAQGREVAARGAQRRRERRRGRGQAGEAGREAGRRKDDDKKPRRRSPTTRKPKRAGAVANVDIDLDGFEARARRAAAQGRQLRRPPGDQGQAAVPAPAAHRLGRREEPDRVLRFRGARGEDGARRWRRVRGDVRRQEAARRAARRSSRSSRSRRRRSSRSRWRPATWKSPVDPRAEWRQMFADAYRFERDFFYDPNMHGVDWAGLRAALRQAARRCGDAVGRELRARRVHRRAERVAHLPAAAATRSRRRSDRSACSASTGSWPNGAYRIKRIVRGGPWDTAVRSPLDEPGVNVKAGDYVLAVNGVPLDAKADPWAAFQGLGDKTVGADGQQHAVGRRARARSSSSA